MKLKNVAAAGALALATAIALSACSGGTSDSSTSTTKASASSSDGAVTSKLDSSLSGTITTGGSSAQANAQTAWTAAVKAQATGVTVNYDKSQGSGGGVTNWLNGSYDFAGTDSALSAAQATQSQSVCGAGGGIDIPVYLSGVAIIFNVPGVTKLNLDSATVAKIFSLQIKTWDDPAIKALNPSATLPSTAITVVSRSDGSGTTNNFTTYLHDTQPSIWTNAPSNAWPIAGTSGQQGGSGVVATVKAGAGTIGYADQSATAGLTAAAIQVGTGKDFVAYSEKGATNAFSAAATTTPNANKGDLTQVLDYTKITNKDSYAIPLLSYVVVCTTFKTSAQAPLTKAYLSYITSTIGQQIAAKNAGAAPLPNDILKDAQTSLALVK